MKTTAEMLALAGKELHRDICERACAGIPDPEVTIPALVEALRDNLALARIKFGNLDPDANRVFAAAEDLLSKLNPSDT